MSKVIALPSLTKLRKSDAETKRDLSYGYKLMLDNFIAHVSIDIATTRDEARLRELRLLRVAANHALDAALELFALDDDRFAEVSHA